MWEVTGIARSIALGWKKGVSRLEFSQKPFSKPSDAESDLPTLLIRFRFTPFIRQHNDLSADSNGLGADLNRNVMI